MVKVDVFVPVVVVMDMVCVPMVLEANGRARQGDNPDWTWKK